MKGIDSIDHPGRLTIQPAIGALSVQTIDQPFDFGREKGDARE
jgi:hypothetical protein